MDVTFVSVSAVPENTAVRISYDNFHGTRFSVWKYFSEESVFKSKTFYSGAGDSFKDT